MTTPSLNPREVNDLHKLSDRDISKEAQHHTLGIGPYQASPGDHDHDGRNSRFISDASGGSGGVGGRLLGWGSVTPFEVTAVTNRIKVSVNLEFSAGQVGKLSVVVTNSNGAVMNDNIMNVGGDASTAGRDQATSLTKFFNCDVDDVVLITPQSFSGTINRIEIYVESAL